MRGAALRTYEVDGRAIVDGFDADEVPQAFNGAVLAPWPNRLRDGAWSYTGARLQLPVNEVATGSALHGLVLWADWQPVSSDSSSVTLRCRINAQPGYPFDVELEVQYSLIELGRSTVGLQVGEESRQVWADREFVWWQVYTSDSFAPTNPRYRWAVAIEPMTCGPDAFNSGVDLIQLAPGTRWCSRWGIAVESLAANLGSTPRRPGVV